MPDPRSLVPRTDTVMADARLAASMTRLGRGIVKAQVRASLALVRSGDLPPGKVVEHVVTHLPATSSSMRKVINATGVIVHTNLGRAPLSHAAVEAMCAASAATDVEYELSTGRRGRRARHATQALLAAVPDAEDVHVVNNGAAALALVAATLGQGKRMIISRGEMVEIGDGFRVPDLLRAFGVELREVGMTNRVSLRDYESAAAEGDSLILKVHTSNYQILGFTSAVSVSELVSLGHSVVADLGSGLLSRNPRLPREPDVGTALRDGAAIVTVSGDKLLGGPQCGLIFGRGDLISIMRRHPVARALRVDKITLSALEATVSGPPPPVAQQMKTPLHELEQRAARVVRAVGPPAGLTRCMTRIGGGGAPGTELPSFAVVLPEVFADPLRQGLRPIVGYLHRDALRLDLRTVEPTDDDVIVRAIRDVMSACES